MVPVAKLVMDGDIFPTCASLSVRLQYVKDFHGVILLGKLEQVLKNNIILSKTAGLESLCYSLKETKGL